MATFTATAAQSYSPALFNVNGTITRVVTYRHTVSASVGDVIQMVRIPNGAVISRLVFNNSASAGVITVNIGDGNDTSAFAASVVLSGSVVALTSMPYRGLGRSYSVEDTIDIQVAGISAPAAETTYTIAVDYIIANGG